MIPEKSSWSVAFSYIRFSILDQGKGDSLRRQTSGFDRYCDEEGLTPARLTLRDLGVSAFRGANQRNGALAVFLRAVREGRVIAGKSVLVVENLDRLSRQEPLDSLDIFREIVNAGVKIVTLTDRQEYTRESIRRNPAQLFIITAIFMRAYEESKTKSERVSAAWAAKRLTPVKPFTRRCPSWLTFDDKTGEFRFNQKAGTMRAIISLALEGRGPAAIATRLNRDKVPTFLNSTHWHFSTIRYLLTTRTLLGEFQPCQMEGNRHVPQGPPIKGYYPAICTEADFYRIANLFAARKRFARGRTGNDVANLFGRLLVCGHDNSTMILRVGHKAVPKLSSIKTNTGATHHPSFPYRPFEYHFLAWVTEVRLSREDAHDGKVVELEGQLAVKCEQVAKANAMALSSNGQTFEGLLELVRGLDAQVAALKQQLEWERARQHKPRTSPADLHKLVLRLRGLPEEDATERREVRDRIKTAIQQVVEQIKLYVFRRGMMHLAVVHVTLRDGLSRLFFVRVERYKQPMSWSSGVAFSFGEHELDAVALGRELISHQSAEDMHKATSIALMKSLKRLPPGRHGPAARYTLMTPDEVGRLVGIA